MERDERTEHLGRSGCELRRKIPHSMALEGHSPRHGSHIRRSRQSIVDSSESQPSLRRWTPRLRLVPVPCKCAVKVWFREKVTGREGDSENIEAEAKCEDEETREET